MPSRTIDGQPITCAACGSPASTRHQIDTTPICHNCWLRLTTEGRAYSVEKTRRSRRKKVL